MSSSVRIGALLCLLALTAGAADDRAAAIERLKATLHTLPPAEAAAQMKEAQLATPPPPHQSKIEHFVVLFMENHAFDAMLGCMDLPGADGIPPEGRLIPKDPHDPSKGSVNVTCGSQPYVCTQGPGYNLFSGKFEPGTNASFYPYANQSDAFSVANGAAGPSVNMFAPDQLPVKYALAKSFGVLNKLYTAVPSASTPNHLMAQSATSCGIVDNIMYSDCGGPTDTFPQFTIYDSLYVDNVSFALYMNSTCGLVVNGTQMPECHGTDPHSPDAGSPIPTPDVAMSGVGRHKSRFMSQARFYEDAQTGSLPAFSWLLPPMEACDHPCHDVAKGERLLKDVYEALRAGPGWEKTLLMVVYDDAGGFYDHVVPPSEGVPSDDAPCHLRSKCSNTSNAFDFRRLGLRTTAMLISPWIAKGSVFQEPRGPQASSQFDLTSIPATVKNLFNLTGFLTKRDQWSGSFHELLADQLQQDTPMHLPEAPAPASPWGPVPNMSSSSPVAQHCSLKTRQCKGPAAVTMKQRTKALLFARLTQTPLPDLEGDAATVERWLTARWLDWMTHTAPFDLYN